MKQTYAVLFRIKIDTMLQVLRKTYYKYLGMQIGEAVKLGKIECSWPNRVRLGTNSEVENNVKFKITKPFAEDCYIQIGERVFLGDGCEFNCGDRVVIGNDCLIASNTTFVDTGHEMKRDTKIKDQPCTFKEIILMDDVWIGTRCVILQGVTIGEGSVIGAGSLVNKSIPEYQIWAGCPARFIKNR